MRAPSASSSPGRSTTSRAQVTGIDRSAAGSRRVRKTVLDTPRRDSWATWPSTPTSPRRPIHSATLRATVRTGHGASGEEGAVTPGSVSRPWNGSGAPGGQRAGLDRLLVELLQPVAQHPQVGLPGAGGLLVGDQRVDGHGLVAAQPAAQLGDRPVVVALDRRGAGCGGAGGLRPGGLGAVGLLSGRRSGVLVDVRGNAGRGGHGCAALVDRLALRGLAL